MLRLDPEMHQVPRHFRLQLWVPLHRDNLPGLPSVGRQVVFDHRGTGACGGAGEILETGWDDSDLIVMLFVSSNIITSFEKVYSSRIAVFSSNTR